MLLRYCSISLLLLTMVGCGDENAPNSDPLFVPILPDASADETDSAVTQAAEMPEARVYLNDPVTDENQVSNVILRRPTSNDGTLTSEWVDVLNCLNEDGGTAARPNFGPIAITVYPCVEQKVVRPDDDGHYLSYEPPADDSDPNDPFAELMMYHHVNLAHDYFKDTFGFSNLDFPLPALVNFQLRTDPVIPFLNPDPDGWIGLSNAAFFPKESWRQFATQFGLPPRESDSIIFFQGDKDFAYDSRVIYHEYTHAVVGTTRLQVPSVLDRYGLDNSAPSMNEGLADFFAASLSGDPRIGRYVGVMGLGLRDLSEFRGCPEDTADEIHAHGELIGSVLWEMRGTLGAEVTDEIAFESLERFGIATVHGEAAEIILERAQSKGEMIGEQTRRILDAHGMLDCERSMPFTRFEARTSRWGLPHTVEGFSSAGIPGLNTYVPAYKQFYIEGQEEQVAVRLQWQLTAGGGDFGGFGGGGGSVDPLTVAYRIGAPVELIAARTLEINADHIFEPELSGEYQTLILSAECLPALGEKAHLLLLNSSNDQVQIPSMRISYLDAVPTSDQVVTCREAQPIDVDGGITDRDAGVPMDAAITDDATLPDEEVQAEDAGLPATDMGAPELPVDDEEQEDAGLPVNDQGIPELPDANIPSPMNEE